MRYAILAGSLGMLMLFGAGSVMAQAAPLKPGTRTISVSGHGEVKAKPNLMVVSFAIDSKAPSGARCTEIQTGKTQRLVAALKAKLGSDAGIETSDYTLNQSYEPESPEDTQTAKPTMVWTYSADIAAGTENMALLGSLIDAGLAAGAADVTGGGFQFFPVKNAGPSTAKPMVHAFNATSVARQYDGFPAGNPMKRTPAVLLEVKTSGDTADQAVRLGAEATDKVEKALKEKLGDHGDLAIQNFGITHTSPSQQQPINSYRPPQERKIFVARTTVTVKTEKLDSLSALIEAGMKNGADQLNSVSFTLSDAAASDDAAIAAASKEAETKARTVANSMNVKLGKILSITVNAQVRPQMVYGSTLMMMRSAAPAGSLQHAIMPVLPRELGVGGDVNAVYEIQ